MTTRRDLFALGLVALSTLMPRALLAQPRYPDRPVRLVIPFPPGGGYDAVGRPWAEKMKSLLGTVVVENQGGGGSSLGAAAAARARPDGYTILLGGAKANPGTVTYGHAGVGSLNHLTGELLKSLTGIPQLVHVPYRGSGPATADAISGQVSMVIPAVTGPLLEFNRTGKLRILAVTGPTRLIAAPEIPTAVEAGFPGMVSQQSIGLFAPAGTPKAIIEQILQATRIAIVEPAYQKMLIEAGFEPDVDSTPEKFRRLVEDDIARWTPIVKAIGLKLD